MAKRKSVKSLKEKYESNAPTSVTQMNNRKSGREKVNEQRRQLLSENEQERSSCLIHQLHLLPFHTSLTVPHICSNRWSPLSLQGVPHPPPGHMASIITPPVSSQGLQNVTQLEQEALKTDEKEKKKKKTQVNVVKKTEHTTSAARNLTNFNSGYQMEHIS